MGPVDRLDDGRLAFRLSDVVECNLLRGAFIRRLVDATDDEVAERLRPVHASIDGDMQDFNPDVHILKCPPSALAFVIEALDDRKPDILEPLWLEMTDDMTRRLSEELGTEHWGLEIPSFVPTDMTG